VVDFDLKNIKENPTCIPLKNQTNKFEKISRNLGALSRNFKTVIPSFTSYNTKNSTRRSSRNAVFSNAMLKPVNTSIKELNDKEEKASSSKGFAKKKRELTVNGFQLNKNISKKLFKSQK